MKKLANIYTPKILQSKVTKRNNTVNGRMNKTAKGITHTITDQSKKSKRYKESVLENELLFNQIVNRHSKRTQEHKDNVGILSVYGTLDKLARNMLKYNVTKVIKHHPTDTSYTKTVYVLNENGKKQLKYKKRNLITVGNV